MYDSTKSPLSFGVNSKTFRTLKKRERKARTTLLMALLEDHLYGFQNISNAKEMWDAIKSRFGGNAESKKMQKYILKQEFESFSVSNSKGLHKGYDRVFESDVKGSGGSSSSAHNVAIIGSECTTSTNEVSTAYGSSTFSGQHTHKESSSSYVDEKSGLEMAGMAMLSMRVNKFYKKTGMRLKFNEKELAGFDKSMVQCFKCHKMGHFARECRSKRTQDSEEGVESEMLAKDDADDCAFTAQVEENFDDFTLMAFTSNNEIKTCTKECEQKYANLKKLFDAQKDQIADYNIEVDLDDKTNVLEYHKKLLAEAIKEKEDLKSKLENFQNYSKVDNRSSDLDDIPLYDRFKKAKGNHAVPPPLTGIYMPPRFPINTGRHNFTSQPTSIRSVRKVNTGRPQVNETRPKRYFYKSHSPFKRPFNNTTTLKTTFTKQKVNTAGVNSVSAVRENRETAVKVSAENPPSALKDEGIVYSGCSRHMTGNKEHLDEYQDIKGGLVTFRGSKGRITGKGKIRTRKLDFENVYFVKELGHFNLFSVLQIYDKRNTVLFTESECLVLSPDFKMPDES
ncbi:ribonuclease H-like domain-containing protein [Tanacetum coccineum]